MNQIMQQQEVQRQSVNPALMAAGVHSEFLRQRMDLDAIKRDIYRAIGGLEWDQQRRKWVQAYPALANKSFLDKAFGFLHAIMNHNTIHANITQEEAHDMTFEIGERIIWLIQYEGEEHGVHIQNMGTIVSTFTNPVFLTLTRAIGDGERNHEDNNFKSTETSTARVMDSGVKI